jgi:GT2 family glycosyltransferase
MVSICIPTYNRARYLAEALTSALAQAHAHFEVIVSDDASTDDTRGVVAAFGDARIRYRSSDRRMGIAANRNRCVELARGRYIAWLDSDDVLAPDMLARQCSVLDARPDVGMVHGAFRVMDEDGRRLPDWPLPHDHDTSTDGAEAFRELAICNFIATPTVVMRRECLERAGRFEPAIGAASTDWDMWLRMSLRGNIAYTAEPAATIRYHERSVSAATRSNGERLRCELAVLRHVFGNDRSLIPGDVSGLAAKAHAALAARALLESGDAFTAGRRSLAARTLFFAVRAYPPLARDLRLWQLLVGTLAGAEYTTYVKSRGLLQRLSRMLEGSRFGRTLGRRARVDPSWQHELRMIAASVRRLVPARARLAVIDKYDPTILHLSRRSGWHFPDRTLLPDGYPRDGAAAIRHLQQLQQRGADHLLIPSSAFWWLDHYEDLRVHLETGHRLVWSDDRCKLFRLGNAPARQRTPTPATPATAS